MSSIAHEPLTGPTQVPCTELEARLLSLCPPRDADEVAVVGDVPPRERYDGDRADLHAVVDYLRSWDGLTHLVDEHLKTGDQASYLRAIGRARMASGASVTVAKRAVELLLDLRSRSDGAEAGRSARRMEQSCD
jgi:hypothetical protein